MMASGTIVMSLLGRGNFLSIFTKFHYSYKVSVLLKTEGFTQIFLNIAEYSRPVMYKLNYYSYHDEGGRHVRTLENFTERKSSLSFKLFCPLLKILQCQY